MATVEIYESAVCSDGGHAAVFEDGGETGYFYLMDLDRPEGRQIVSALQIYGSNPGVLPGDIQVVWDMRGSTGGLMIKGVPWSLFDLDSGQYYNQLNRPVGRFPYRRTSERGSRQTSEWEGSSEFVLELAPEHLRHSLANQAMDLPA